MNMHVFRMMHILNITNCSRVPKRKPNNKNTMQDGEKCRDFSFKLYLIDYIVHNDKLLPSVKIQR